MKNFYKTKIKYDIYKNFGIKTHSHITRCKSISDIKISLPVDLYDYLINISPNKYKHEMPFLERIFSKYNIIALEHFYKQMECEIETDYTGSLIPIDVSSYNCDNITNYLI